MRKDIDFGGITKVGYMESVPKTSKPTHTKHTGLIPRAKSKEGNSSGPRRRYSVDMVSQKPLMGHSYRNGLISGDHKPPSQRRLSLGTKLEQEKAIHSENRLSEVKSILKSGAGSLRTISSQSSETDSTKSEEKEIPSEIKCSYRLPPKTSGTGKLRKSVSFREEDLDETNSRRRFSSPTLDVQTSLLLTPASVI